VSIVIDVDFGIGWRLPEGETLPDIRQGRLCFWGGWGGSFILSDLDRRVTLSYMMNKMAPGIIGSDRSEAYIRAAYGCLHE
jgi:CubicO group peptidase (beta-lactamase class C family)